MSAEAIAHLARAALDPDPLPQLESAVAAGLASVGCKVIRVGILSTPGVAIIADHLKADGGIAHLWATAGGPSIELQQIDYGEVLRDKRGDAGRRDRDSIFFLFDLLGNADDHAVDIACWGRHDKFFALDREIG